MRGWGWAVLLVGCGRFEFDPRIGDGGVTVDGPTGSVTEMLGECAGATITGVTRDTFIDSGNPTNNMGGADDMRIDAPTDELAMIHFDLSDIPAGAMVLSAELFISVTPTDSVELGYIEVVPMLEAWSEGTGDYTAGQAANWTMRDMANAWSVVGAGVGSRGTTVLGMFSADMEGVRHTVALDANTIDAWVAAPASNHGMAFVGVNTQGSGGWLYTREAADPSVRPCLRLIYVP